jgi:hypothetical protein
MSTKARIGSDSPSDPGSDSPSDQESEDVELGAGPTRKQPVQNRFYGPLVIQPGLTWRQFQQVRKLIEDIGPLIENISPKEAIKREIKETKDKLKKKLKKKLAKIKLEKLEANKKLEELEANKKLEATKKLIAEKHTKTRQWFLETYGKEFDSDQDTDEL